MLDPLSALGVVSNVVQLISFTADIVKDSRAYVKGSRTSHSCDVIAQLVEKQQASFTNIIAMESALGPLNNEEQAVRNVAEACVKEGRELIAILENVGFKAEGEQKRKLASAIVISVKSRLKGDSIERHRQALDRYQNQLSLALTSLIRRDQSLHFAALREVIEYQSEKDQRGLLDSKSKILEVIEEQRKRYDALAGDTAAKLNHLALSAAENRDVLLEHQAHAQYELLSKVTRHQQQTSQIAEDAAGEFDKLLEHLWDLQEQLDDNKAQEKAKRILQSLHFPDMRLRRDTIVEAHSKTFEWAFTEDNSEFKKWLKCEEGRIFWVNGKAGSGKSTLMKFLAHDPRTETLLRSWAGKDARLFILDFYFWYLGTRLQKSEEGLLRTILYQTLRKCPFLMPYVTPQRWENPFRSDDPWSLRELRQAVERIASSGNATSSTSTERISKAARFGLSYSRHSKFCFFIDGLDEYDADHLYLVDLLQALSTKLRVKVCVSSRPWNVFTRAFGDLQQQLVLEDLTRDDVKLYVRAELASLSSEGGLEGLAEEVAAKAQGVFLWVFLAVRSLREGISEGDSISLLRERVAQLPSDLRDYFELILSRVHPVYRKSKTMTALYIAMCGTRDQPADDRWPLTLSFLNFWILREGMDDPKIAIRQEVTYLDASLCSELGRRTRTFLNAVCKDLLYLPFHRKGYTTASQLVFLHRTVYEFLESDEMWPKVEAGMLAHTRGRYFNISMEYARLKFVESSEETFSLALALINRGGGRELDVPLNLREAMSFQVERMRKCSPQRMSAHISADPSKLVVSLIDSLFRRSRIACATDTLSTSELLHQQWCYDFLLRGALALSNKTTFWVDNIYQPFLEYVLSFHVDVNLRLECERQTAWEAFLERCIASCYPDRSLTKDVASELWTIARILIQHGADPNTRLQNGWSAQEGVEWFVPSERQTEVQQLLMPGTETQSSDAFEQGCETQWRKYHDWAVF